MSEKQKQSEAMVVPLTEGVDFDSRSDYTQLLQVIKDRLKERALLGPDVLLAGYNAENDRRREEVSPRESTWAMPLREAEANVESPFGMHPFVYAGVKRAKDGEAPTVAVYDPSKLSLEHPDEPGQYKALPGHTIDSAKIIEFPIIYAEHPAVLK
jgi:hypothetical protein